MKVGIYFEDYEFGHDLPPSVLQNYHLLCVFALDPIRERFGKTTITSGYRTEQRNLEVGGSPTSQHLFGEAADFICRHAESMGLVYRFLLDELAWKGEIIWYKKRGHIHVSLPRLGVKMDQFTKED